MTLRFRACRPYAPVALALLLILGCGGGSTGHAPAATTATTATGGTDGGPPVDGSTGHVSLRFVTGPDCNVVPTDFTNDPFTVFDQTPPDKDYFFAGDDKTMTRRRALYVNLAKTVAVGSTVPIGSPTVESDYQEVFWGQPRKTWKAVSGSVTLVSRSEGKAHIELADVRFVPNAFDPNSAAAGDFTLSGWVDK